MSEHGAWGGWRRTLGVAAGAVAAMGAQAAAAAAEAPIPIGPTAPVANPGAYSFPRSVLQVEPFGLHPWLLVVPFGLVAIALVMLLVQWARARREV